jgi:hypothetical protein
MLLIWLVVGEPGQAVSQHLAYKAYRSVDSPAAITQITSSASPISRVLLDVSRKTPKGVERKDRVLLITHANADMLGAALRPAADADRSAMNVSETGGAVVEDVTPKSNAANSDIKKGDLILRCSRMPLPGIYADKSLLQYRLLAFLPAGLIALILGSLLGKPHPKDKLDRFYALLKTPVGKESELEKQGVDVVYAGASKGHPWEINHPRAVNVIGFLIAFAISLLFVALLWWIGRVGA